MKAATTMSSRRISLLLPAILLLTMSPHHNGAHGRRLGEPPQQPLLQDEEDTDDADLNFLRALDRLKSQAGFHHRRKTIAIDGGDDGFYYVGKANEFQEKLRNLKADNSNNDDGSDTLVEMVDHSGTKHIKSLSAMGNMAIRVTSDGDLFMSSSSNAKAIINNTRTTDNDEGAQSSHSAETPPSRGSIGDDDQSQSAEIPPSRGSIGDDDDDEKNKNEDRDLAIIGRDDRYIVPNTRSWPYRLVGLLFSQPNAEGLRTMCTGTVISSNTILTNAHCVYDTETDTFVPLDGFVPAVTRYGPLKNFSFPYGFWEYESVTMYSEYSTEKNSPGDYDIAVVKLKSKDGRGIGDLIGHAGIRQTDFDSPQLQSATIVGYPSDKELQMWASGRSECSFQPISYYGVMHQCDTQRGSSGSALMDPQGYVHGVHWGARIMADNSSFNLGNILRDSRYNDIVEWSQAA